MDDDLDTLIDRIDAEVARLTGMPRADGSSGALADRLGAWRQAVSAHPDAERRDRALWALLGAERHLRAMHAAGDQAPDGQAARVRLDAAVRALREMEPGLEAPPDPAPG